jgi:hypothetical protein
VHGEQDDLGLWQGFPQPSGSLDSIQVWHADIQNRHVRMLLAGNPQGFRTIEASPIMAMPAVPRGHATLGGQ